MEPDERAIRVPRTARYAVLGDPATASELWFVLHGYRQLARRFIRRFDGLPGLGSGDRAVVAPEGLSRFYIEREVRGPHGPESRVGASWMTREDRESEIRDYVEYLDLLVEEVGSSSRHPHPGTGSAPPRLVVLGFSQGCETAARWVSLGRVNPAELVLWGGGLAEDLPRGPAVRALGDLRLRLVVGDEDQWARRRSMETLERMRHWGLPADEDMVLRYHGGHRINPALLAKAWPWPADR